MQIEREQFIAPHPVVDGAQGRPVRICPIILYSDDTSGNLSKKWNCFNIWCVQLAALPRSENAKLQNIFYITCSNAVQSKFSLWIANMHLYIMIIIHGFAVYVYNNKSLIIIFLCLWVYINKWLVVYAYMSYKFNLLQFHGMSSCPAMEMFQPLKAELLRLEKGVVMYDACLAKEVLVVAPVLFAKCDNPRASELLGHMGTNANMFCRMCMVS